MAEAIQLPSMGVSNKYFCYHCNRAVFLYQASEMSCPECRSDFIEEVLDEHEIQSLDDPDYEEESDVDESELNLLNLLSIENLFRRVVGDANPDSEEADADEIDSPRPDEELYTARSMLRHLEDNFTQGNRERLRHVGDYLFGDDIDTLSTMLLNETEIVGPPPLPKDQIKLLPVVTVSKDDVAEKEVQCTICMEDFAVREKAKSLPCSHFYHEKCIAPWLERHATCPNCRKPVEVQSKSHRSQSCPRTDHQYSLSHTDQRRSSESTSVTGFFTTSMNPFRFL